MDTRHIRRPSVEKEGADSIEHLVEVGEFTASDVIPGPVVVAEAFASLALLQSISVSENGVEAEKNEPTEEHASSIHPAVSSH